MVQTLLCTMISVNRKKTWSFQFNITLVLVGFHTFNVDSGLYKPMAKMRKTEPSEGAMPI